MTTDQISMIGIDIAKHVFQIHATDAAGRPVLQKRVRRSALLDVIHGKALHTATIATGARHSSAVGINREAQQCGITQFDD